MPRAEDLARLPVVALVGRPNTGKSTLFNRITRSRRALVASTPGVTRDRNVAVAEHAGRSFLVVDTGGFETDEREEMGREVRGQALVAAEQADAIIVLVDGRAGVSPLDVALVRELRKLPHPLFLAVNKIDTPRQESLLGEFHRLGLDRAIPISAEHGLNVAGLMTEVLAFLPEAREEGAAASGPTTSVAIIGRPNVGKSSLLNRLLGYERTIVTSTPGTTRDAIDTAVTRGERSYVLVDTAGVRRRPKVSEHLERASVVRALRALERAEVGVLVIDAIEGMTEQDARVGGYAWDRGRALILVVNKWDARPEGSGRDSFARGVDLRFPSFSVVPKLFVSALTGKGVERLWEMVDEVAECHRAHLATPKLNQALSDAVRKQQPPAVQNKRPRFFYAAQTATAPVTITVFCSYPEFVPADYERYLVNQLRAAFDLQGTPIRLRFRRRDRSPARRGRAPGRKS